MKRIGYAAQNLTLGTSASRTMRLRNVTAESLRVLIGANLASLGDILLWNARNDIKFYRITSGLIPYASHPVNALDWQREFRDRFQDLAALIDKHDLQVSMHPAQYTVLSSEDPQLVDKSLKELEYHNAVLDLLGTGAKGKIVLHLGGAYENKAASMKRWIDNYKRLSEAGMEKLVIENNGKIYDISHCLEINGVIGIPVVFDLLHYQIHPEGFDEITALTECLNTWKEQPVLPEIHYSDQAAGRPSGAHAESIETGRFTSFYYRTKDLPFNIMLETKDKELSVLKVKKALTESHAA